MFYLQKNGVFFRQKRGFLREKKGFYLEKRGFLQKKKGFSPKKNGFYLRKSEVLFREKNGFFRKNRPLGVARSIRMTHVFSGKLATSQAARPPDALHRRQTCLSLACLL